MQAAYTIAQREVMNTPIPDWVKVGNKAIYIPTGDICTIEDVSNYRVYVKMITGHCKGHSSTQLHTKLQQAMLV